MMETKNVTYYMGLAAMTNLLAHGKGWGWEKERIDILDSFVKSHDDTEMAQMIKFYQDICKTITAPNPTTHENYIFNNNEVFLEGLHKAALVAITAGYAAEGSVHSIVASQVPME